jgi:trehalose 6-phosphate phosphatase
LLLVRRHPRRGREGSPPQHAVRTMERHPLDLSVQQACALAAQVLNARPSALVSDLDGTLSPIVPTPQEASVLPGCRRALERIRDRLDLVAVVSGRPGSEAKRLLGMEGVVYLGNHGLDRWIGLERQAGQAGRGWGSLQPALEELREALAGQEGLRFEDKGATISIHYRSTRDPEAARSRVLAAAAQAAVRHDLAVGEGKRVVELRPSYWAGKGAGLEELAHACGLRGLVYLGDDCPDLHAFETLAQLRQSEDLLALSVGVIGPESPPELADRADVLLSGPEQVEAFLEDLVETLG